MRINAECFIREISRKFIPLYPNISTIYPRNPNRLSGYFSYPFEISLLFYGYSDYHSYICPNYKQTQDGEEDKTKDKVYFPKGIGR